MDNTISDYMKTIYGYLPVDTKTNKSKWLEILGRRSNLIEWNNVFYNLMNQMLELFQWNGLPDTCNERFLEFTLITEGKAIIAQDQEYGLLSLRAGEMNLQNIYGESSRVKGWGAIGFQRTYENYMYGTGFASDPLDNNIVNGSDTGIYVDGKAILCRDNLMMYPYINYLFSAADRLSDLHRSIDVVVKHLKKPYIISCKEEEVESITRILEDIDDNLPAIVASRSFGTDSLQVLNTGVSADSISVLWEAFNNEEAYNRDRIGLKNATNLDKKERLLVDEVNSNEEHTELNLDMRLRARQDFCKIVNQEFGTSISVELRNKEEEEGEEDVLEDEEETIDAQGEA